MIMRKLGLTIMLAAIFFPRPAGAEWTGPREVFSTEWGEEGGKIGLYEGKLSGSEKIPAIFDIDSEGRILIDDQKNGRLMLFSEKGVLVNTINPGAGQNPDASWSDAQFIGAGSLFLRQGEFYRIYDQGGKLALQFYGPEEVEEIYLLEDGSIMVLNSGNKKYYRFARDGSLGETYAARPQELGIWKIEKILRGKNKWKNKVTITYPEKKEYTVITQNKFAEYRRADGVIYGWSREQVCRFDRGGEGEECVVVPKDEYTRSSLMYRYDNPEISAEYGLPLIGPEGSVYVWKRTPYRYRILKWEWEEEENYVPPPEEEIIRTESEQRKEPGSRPVKPPPAEVEKVSGSEEKEEELPEPEVQTEFDVKRGPIETETPPTPEVEEVPEPEEQMEEVPEPEMQTQF